MLLTKKELEKIIEQKMAYIPDELKKQLLEEYGQTVIDDEGHEFEYTDQDIYMQLDKKLKPYIRKVQVCF